MKLMMEEKRYPSPRVEQGMVSEPSAMTADAVCAGIMEIPCDVDFGYPRTTEEVRAEAEEALCERHDESKWMTNDAFWAAMKQDLPWVYLEYAN